MDKISGREEAATRSLAIMGSTLHCTSMYVKPASTLFGTEWNRASNTHSQPCSVRGSSAPDDFFRFFCLRLGRFGFGDRHRPDQVAAIDQAQVRAAGFGGWRGRVAAIVVAVLVDGIE